MHPGNPWIAAHPRTEQKARTRENTSWVACSKQGSMLGPRQFDCPNFHLEFDICDRLWENRPLRALLQNRVIGIQG